MWFVLYCKVWSEASGRKKPSPGDFLWVGLERIMLGPECTTVLCKDNGQAIAWYTPARCTGIKPHQAWAEHHENVESCREDTLSCEEESIPATEINCPDNTPFLLIKRKKHVFRVCHSPWSQNPSSINHPSCFPSARLPGPAAEQPCKATHRRSPGQKTCHPTFPADWSGGRACSISRALCRRNDVPWPSAPLRLPPPAVPHCSYTPHHNRVITA
ncbi:lamin tail domain-containing protein 1-like isoform 1-T1 [Salvelinus alpinus]